MSEDPVGQPGQAPESTEEPKWRHSNLSRNALVVLVIPITTFVVGFVIARVLPPFVLDDLFWRDFLSGPPVTGIFALIAAVVAFAAAKHSAKVARRNAEEQEWWNRAEWALKMAASDNGLQRVAGLTAISVMISGPKQREDALLLEVAVAIEKYSPENDVDATGNSVDNGKEGGESHGVQKT
ncbi:hypothetical protein [Glutamicibacter arilaitensis]|uniref:hypothetical protein n=1 Tax=Glutamicibacter arilaitensis TaxID=256701 RepID=UPI00384F094F